MILIKYPIVAKDLPEHTVDVPPSKYVANRLLILAALARGESILKRVPISKDVETVLQGLDSLGIFYEKKEIDAYTFDILIKGCDGHIGPVKQVFSGDNGTFSRFVAPILLLGGGPSILDASAQMRLRPMGHLFSAMQSLGAEINCIQKENCLPACISGKYLGGNVSLPGSVSSQYFSALLLCSPYAENDMKIQSTTPLVSSGYVSMTIEGMCNAGAIVKYGVDPYPFFSVVGGRKKTYHAFEKTIETDPSSATYFMAMVALNKMHLRLPNFPSYSKQGEAGFYKVLESIGCKVFWENVGAQTILKLSPPENYAKKIDVDLTDMPDAGPTLLTICVALGHLRGISAKMRGIGHLRYKESNRVEGMCTELRKIGACIDIGEKDICIHPAILKKSVMEETALDSLGDHRLAMSFALLSLVTGCVLIDNEDSIDKTFPHFFDFLKKIGFCCEKK